MNILLFENSNANSQAQIISLSKLVTGQASAGIPYLNLFIIS